MVSTDYVAFIDPDDYIEKDYLEKLYNAADKTNADLVWCDYVENCESKIPLNNPSRVMSDKSQG